MTTQVSFEESIDLSHKLIARFDSMTAAERADSADLQAEMRSLLIELVSARGFFVSLLTGDWSFGEEIPEPIVDIIRSLPDPSFELLAKNLAMSQAARVANLRNGKEKEAAGSLQVSKRTAYIIRKLNDNKLMNELQKMLTALEFEKMSGLNNDNLPRTLSGHEVYLAFLSRWKYDDEQKQEIRKAIYNALGSSK